MSVRLSEDERGWLLSRTPADGSEGDVLRDLIAAERHRETTMTTQQLQTWIESADRAGDTETAIIARIALGHPVDLAEYADALRDDQRERLETMGQDEARDIASRWVSGE